MFVKLGTHTTFDKRTSPIAFKDRCLRSKSNLVNKINPFYIANYYVISLLNSPVGRILQRWRCSCSFYYRIVNVFNQQICLVNALHIFTSSFSATNSNSYLVASINSQHLNHMVSNQCHILFHYSVIPAPRLLAYGFNQCMSH